MSLRGGFEHFEGLALFGYTLEADPIEVIVILTDKSIEIRTINEELISHWAAGSYYSNEQAEPYHAFISHGQWLKPHDKELEERLFRHIGIQTPIYKDEKKPKSQRLWLALALGVSICLLAFLVFWFMLETLAMQLLKAPIRERLDEQILSFYNEGIEICNPTESEALHKILREYNNGQDFVIVNNLPFDYGFLPSAKLAIDAGFAQNIPPMGALPLLSLAHSYQNTWDTGLTIFQNLDFAQKLDLLIDGEIDPDILHEAWLTSNLDIYFSNRLLENMPEILGDYQEIAPLLGWENYDYPYDAPPVELHQNDWWNMIKLCKIDE